MRFKLGNDLRGQHQQVRSKHAVRGLIDNLHHRISRDNDELVPCRHQPVVILNNYLTAVRDMTNSRKKEFDLMQAMHFAGTHFTRREMFMSKMELLHSAILIYCRSLLTELLPERDY